MNRTIKRLVVLISGNGSTLQSVIDATRWQTLGAEVIAVFSHEAWSYGLLRAEREGIPAVLHDLAKFRIEGKSEYEYNQALAEQVSTYNPDLVGVVHPLLVPDLSTRQPIVFGHCESR